MTGEELQIKLYQRMTAEQKRYRDWLLSQSPNIILDHAYSYSIREDIIIAMEDLELPSTQVRALLKSRTPLSDVYEEWQDTETNHMDDIQAVIENRADAVLQAERERSQRDRGAR